MVRIVGLALVVVNILGCGYTFSGGG
ncbi:MAG: hypothetical protein RL417_487, partial [Pseudomonadota bacterium]